MDPDAVFAEVSERYPKIIERLGAHPGVDDDPEWDERMFR